MTTVASEANMGGEDHQQHYHPKDNGADVNRWLALSRRHDCLQLATNGFLNRRHAGKQSSAIITRPKVGRDFISIDLRRDRIGQCPFESEADFDPQLSILNSSNY